MPRTGWRLLEGAKHVFLPAVPPERREIRDYTNQFKGRVRESPWDPPKLVDPAETKEVLPAADPVAAEDVLPAAADSIAELAALFAEEEATVQKKLKVMAEAQESRLEKATVAKGLGFIKKFKKAGVLLP